MIEVTFLAPVHPGDEVAAAVEEPGAGMDAACRALRRSRRPVPGDNERWPGPGAPGVTGSLATAQDGGTVAKVTFEATASTLDGGSDAAFDSAALGTAG